jgi:hypothetical protein
LTLVNKHASHVWSKVRGPLRLVCRWTLTNMYLDHGVDVDGSRASNFRIVRVFLAGGPMRF